MQFNLIHSRTGVNIFKTSIVILSAVAAYLLWGDVVRETLGVLFGACILAFILSPISIFLEKRFKRPLAAALSVFGAAALFPLLLAIFLPSLLRQFSAIAETLPEAFSRISAIAEGAIAWLEKRFPFFDLPADGMSSAKSSLSDLAKGAISTAGSLAGGAYKIFLMAVLSCFLIADRSSIFLRLELLLPSAWRKLAVRAGSTLARDLRIYLRGQATIAIAVGTLAAIGLILIGVGSAPVLGAIVGIFNVIPYFGPLLGGIPAFIMALGDGWQKACLVVIMLFGVQQIDGLVISPRVMGNITGFSPAVVLLALFAGARIGNIGGMLLAIPALLAFRTLYRVFVQRHEKN